MWSCESPVIQWQGQNDSGWGFFSYPCNSIHEVDGFLRPLVINFDFWPRLFQTVFLSL